MHIYICIYIYIVYIGVDIVANVVNIALNVLRLLRKLLPLD